MPTAPDLSGICRIGENNWGKKTSDAADGKVSFLFTPQNDGSLCQGCEPNYQTAYTCGPASQDAVLKQEHREDGLGVQFNCTQENATCKSGTLRLENGGRLYFSMGGSTKWVQQYTPGIPTADYKANSPKSKYGTNTLSTGQSLRIGEFVGSPNGDAYLTVVKDGGHVKLVVASRTSACKKQWAPDLQDLSYASQNVAAAALYKMKLGPVSTAHKGRVAYINNNNEREFYGNRNLQVAGSDKYYPAGKYVQPKAASVGTVTQASDRKRCEIECNKLDECYGFIHDEEKGSCELKGPEMFPNTLDRVPVADAHMFVRLKNVTNSNSCSDQIAGVEAANFNTLTAGRTITDTDHCRLALSTEDATASLTTAQSYLDTALGSFAKSMSDLSGTGGTLQAMDDEQVGKRKLAVRDHAAARGMQGEAHALQPSVNAMETSASYDMISSNYQLMVWTTVAMIAVIGGIRASR